MAESTSSSSSSTTYAAEVAADTSADELAAQEILQGLKDALTRREATRKKNIPLTPEMRDELLQESFPKIPVDENSSSSKTAALKELSTEECLALRLGLQSVIRTDVKQKMTQLQEQLSEYHAVLEDVIAFKSRCELLEQDKKDLVTLCHEACQVRDDKIALLEKEVARLQWERVNGEERRRRKGSVCSSCGNNDGYSSFSDPQDYCYQPRRQPSPPLSRMPVYNHHYQAYMESSRRLTLSPGPSYCTTTTTATMDPSSCDFDLGSIQPLPFQSTAVPSRYYVPKGSGERGIKRNRPTL